MKNVIRFAIASVIFFVISHVGHAGLILEFGKDNVVGLTSFSAVPGSSLTLQLYLTQTDAETRLSNASTGLVIADFTVVGSGGLGVLPSSTTFGTGFVDDGSGFTGVTGTTARIAEFIAGGNSTSGVTTSTDGVADNSVLLGTITYQIGPGASGTVNLLASQFPQLGSFSLADPGIPLNISVSSGNAVINVSAVPEPSSIGLISVGVALIGFRYGKSRKRKIAR